METKAGNMAKDFTKILNQCQLVQSIAEDCDNNQYLVHTGHILGWMGRESWLATIAEELNKRYRELRKDIKDNTNSWSYCQYCERLAYHYFDLACYYNDTLYNEFKIDLKSTKKHLEKCLEKLEEISQCSYSIQTKKLKKYAGKYFAEINGIYAEQKIHLRQYKDSNVKRYFKLCIALGHINHISLKDCSDEKSRQLLQNIQLLRVINTLENAITVPEDKKTCITSNLSDYLVQAYQLAGLPALSLRYQRTSEKINEIRSIKRKKIKDIINIELEKQKSDLVLVKSYLEETFDKSLSTIDDAYVDKKYIKYCARFWLKETNVFLEKLTASKSGTIIQEIFNSVDNINGLRQINNPLNQLEYYALLMGHYELITIEEEKNLLSRFKIQCMKQIVAYTDSAREEFVFLEAFNNFLGSSKHLQSVIPELSLDGFCRGQLSFSELVDHIMKLKANIYGNHLAVLQDAIKCLKTEGDLFLIGTLKEVLSTYLKPVIIQEIRIDGRLVIEVTGWNIVISANLSRVESHLLVNASVEEIRFVGDGVIHIDANLIGEVWQGKNVVILTKAIQVPDKVTVDVSGKDNNHNYSDNAGTGEDGHGKQGKDGHPGESGGNILVLAEEIDHPENLTIISNGGKGSKGQDGGNGIDGEDGKSISEADFKDKFPPVARFLEQRGHNIAKILRNISSDLLKVETVWCTNGRSTIQGILEDIGETFENAEPLCDASDEVAPSYDLVFVDFKENIFIEATTKHGNKITFSYERGGFSLTACQAFLLCKGSPGQPGGGGGEYGLGGEGGYAGEITVQKPESNLQFNIMKDLKQREYGENGRGGLFGDPGKNGCDMGYLDHSFLFWPTYYGPNYLEYRDNDIVENVWCPYKNKYIGIKCRDDKQRKQKKYEERKNIRENDERQRYAQAVRKKNISQSSILANYAHHFSSMRKDTWLDLRSDLENTKQRALQAITENQEEKQTMEVQIKRHFCSAPHSLNKTNKSDRGINKAVSKESIDVDGLIENLKTNFHLQNNWLQLKEMEVNPCKLDELFSVFETFLQNQNLQNDAKSSDINNIEKLLVGKYRYAILQKIAKQLEPYQEVTNHVELTPRKAEKNLIEAEGNDSNIFHTVLGRLNQYLFEDHKDQHEKIAAFVKSDLLNTENEALNHSIGAFVLELGELEDGKPDIKKYYNKHKEFLGKRKRILYLLFTLTRRRHAEMPHLRLNSIDDKSDVGLCDLLNKELASEYDWSMCCQDQVILNEFIDLILAKGLSLSSYRELLAHIFNVNIRIYIEHHNNLFLQGEHNPSCKEFIHVLCRGNKFILLNIDRNYLILEEERRKKDSLYAQVFAEINKFKLKQEFDDYLKNANFLFNNNPSEDVQYFNDEDLETIVDFFPKGDNQLLKERLEKIAYLGQQEILHSMLKRFSSEGRHVSTQELCSLVNSILTFISEERKVNIFCWIVSAYPQRSWIDELLLLKLEDYFKMPLPEKSKWRDYLSKIENKGILLLFKVKLDHLKSFNLFSMHCIEETLRLLSNIPNEAVTLEGLELSEWPYALKEKYWTCKLKKLVDWQMDDLPTASYYLLSIENIFGALLTEQFLEALENKKQELQSDKLTSIFSNFHNEEWNLSEEELNDLKRCNIHEWTQKMQLKFISHEREREIEQLVEIITGNGNTSMGIKENLRNIANSIEKMTEDTNFSNFTEDVIKSWAEKFIPNISEGKQIIEETHEKMLAMIDRAIELKRGLKLNRIFKLRNTQKLTVLALLKNNHSTLAQVSTGEGKSLIVVAISIIKALSGEKVDIITSSSVLAKRDADGNRDIYDLFGINVSHNCSEDIETRKETYSCNPVVYGDLSNFQRDYLLDKFYGKNILGDRNFLNVIVDEVDNMLLDKGNNMLYLSHDLPILDKLESVYIYIWQWINRPARTNEELAYAFDERAIKEAVLNDLFGFIKKEDIGKLGSQLSEQQQNILWEELIKSKIIDDQGKLLKEHIDDNELCEIPELNSYRDRLHYLLKECIERDKFIRVPRNLSLFIERHLESWINNAITAFCMKAGEDYVVDVDKTCTSTDRNPNITILDRDTGTDLVNSQWDEALHQFLQLKHGCKISLQSLKAVFISNVSYFKLYDKLYGLTGTLGSLVERDLLREVYEVDFVTIPPAKSKKFHEETPILCVNKDEWINNIYSKAKELTEVEKRSVLIICDTVNDVGAIYKAFGGKNAKHVHTYTRDYEVFDEGFTSVQGNKELGQGQIIIGTNLTGRGTDIKITEELRIAKGLHICLSYLPTNIRIEQQAFGRAARCGDPGSGQLITISKGKEYSYSKILDLKKERDSDELNRLSYIRTYYNTQISTEEECFKSFKDQYELLERGLDHRNVPAEVKRILLQSCLDKWAFWLDEHSKYVRELTDEQDKRNLYSRLKIFISQLQNFETGFRENLSSYELDSTSWLVWVEGNPTQMIKLGKLLSQNETCKNAQKNAIELFNKVIKDDQYFSEAAHYYKAFTLSKKVNWEQHTLEEKDRKILKELKRELREAAKLFEARSTCAINAGLIIGKIKKNCNESIIQINAYEEQKNSIANIYSKFSRSIDDIFGHAITPDSFVSYNIKEELAESLYKDLLEKGMLKKRRVKKNASEEKLKAISCGFGVLVETLKSFLSNHRYTNDKEFHKVLKSAVALPSREAFWKLLVEKGILHGEVKCVMVDTERLRVIDPSLLDLITKKVEDRELETETIKLNNEQIFLYLEKMEHIKNSGNMYKNAALKEIVGAAKYKILKEKSVLSFNKKAFVDPTKFECGPLPYYDAITLEDLINKANISKSEAEKILEELCKEKVLEKRDHSESYALKIKFNKIHQIKLSYCPIYKNAIKGLLFICFTYRIALQKMAESLQGDKFSLRLPLRPKPHQNLVAELLNEEVIRPVTVTTEDRSFEEEFMDLYNCKMTIHKFKHMLCQNNLIEEGHKDELFNLLVKKGWIAKDDLGPEESIYINSPEKRQKPLSFSSEGTLYNSLPNIDKSVENFLDNRLHLAKKHTIEHVVGILKRSRSSLKSKKVPDSKLKSFSDNNGQDGFGNMEMHTFSLSGLDQLLEIEEKKWTREMLLNTALVAVMGVCQVAIGVVIELYSVGVMTHVGAAFINEGINDLLFAASALKSGYFSWEDYRQHKLESLMITAVTAGIGAYLARGAKVSRFGHKLAPAFEVGEKVTGMSGSQLIGNVGWKVVGKEVAKRTVLKVIEGVAYGFANVGVDTIIDNYLQKLCEGIVHNWFLSDIEQMIERHFISNSLKEAHETLGEENAKTMVTELTESFFTEKNCLEKSLSIVNTVVGSISQGIVEAVNKVSKAGNNLELGLPINALRKIMVLSERSIQIVNTTMIANNLLDNLEQEIRDILNKSEKCAGYNQTQDYENFKKEIFGQWKAFLSERIGQIITRHIVSPIVKSGTHHLVKYFGKKIKEEYQCYKENGYFESFEKIKLEYNEKVKGSQQCDNTSKIENQITDEYHKVLDKLLEQTKNPKLIDNILKELDNSKNKDVRRSAEKLQKNIEKVVKSPLERVEAVMKNTELKINKIIETLEDKEFQKYMKDKMAGKKDVKYTGPLGIGDKGKLGVIERILSENMPLAYDGLHKAKDLTALKSAFVKAQKMENSQEEHSVASKITCFSNFVLKTKFEKDHSAETLPKTYEEQRSYETVAVAEKNGVLYLACNYQVSKDSGQMDKKGNPIIDASKYGWGEDHIFIANKLVKMCKAKGIERLVFIELQRKPTIYSENRAPHAEMQLHAYAKEVGISFDNLDISKPPCVRCMNVIDQVGIKYRERPGVNINPKNWKKPEDIEVKVTGQYQIPKFKGQTSQNLRFQRSYVNKKPMAGDKRVFSQFNKKMPVSKKTQNFKDLNLLETIKAMAAPTIDNAEEEIVLGDLPDSHVRYTSLEAESLDLYQFVQPRMRSYSL